tara:strand:- start:320 stop:928 length:609 start_codon:yes stop_codon:yes gene_type:complete
MRSFFLSAFIVLTLPGINYNFTPSTTIADKATTFKKVLLVNYHNYGTYSFSFDLTESLQEQYKEKGTYADYLPIFIDQEEYKVPFTEDEIIEIKGDAKAEIDKNVLSNDIDLLIVFMPIYSEDHPFSGEGSNTQLEKITYSIKAIETSTNKLLWESEFSVKSAIDLTLKSKKIAKMIFKQLENNQLACNRIESTNKLKYALT